MTTSHFSQCVQSLLDDPNLADCAESFRVLLQPVDISKAVEESERSYQIYAAVHAKYLAHVKASIILGNLIDDVRKQALSPVPEGVEPLSNEELDSMTGPLQSRLDKVEAASKQLRSELNTMEQTGYSSPQEYEQKWSRPPPNP